MQKGADQAITISQAFLVKDEFRLSTLAHALRTRDIRDLSANEDGFEGNLRADIEAVGTQSNAKQLPASEHLEGIRRIGDAISYSYAHTNAEEKLVELITEGDGTVIPSPNVAGTLSQDCPILHFLEKLRDKMYWINVICRNKNTVAASTIRRPIAHHRAVSAPV